MGNVISAECLRDLAKSSLFGGEYLAKGEENEIILSKFLSYIDAYCAELKTTEHEILLNDELFNDVYSIFSNISSSS